MTCSSTYHGPCNDPAAVNISFCCPCGHSLPSAGYCDPCQKRVRAGRHNAYCCHQPMRICQVIGPSSLAPAQTSPDLSAPGRNQQPTYGHCERGHEFTPENTYIRKVGKRECRTCTRERSRGNRRRRAA